MVRLFSDDRVEVGQTRAHDDRRRLIVGAGYPVMRLDVETDEWVARIQNPATGQWEDIEAPAIEY
jgi:hypothetical protein